MKYGFTKPEYESFPPIVHVETTNACNLRCIHCPHQDVKNIIPGYQAEFMKFETWQRVVDEVSQHPVALRITPDGEPMLSRHWIQQVQYALDKKIDTFTFNTHGMFLEDEKAEVLLQPSETDVVVEVSLDGLYRETYDDIRVRSDYRRVLRNTINFVHRRDELKRDNVKVMVSIVAQPEVSEEELRAFDRFWGGIVDKVIIRNYVDTKGLTPKKNIEDRHVEKRWPCLVLFTRLVVTWDGRVRFCPDDWLKETTLEQLSDEWTLQAIWQSPKFKALRQSHLDGTFEHPTCAKCTDWKVIRWGKDYTAALEQVKSNTPEKKDNLHYIFGAQREGAEEGNPRLKIVQDAAHDG